MDVTEVWRGWLGPTLTANVTYDDRVTVGAEVMLFVSALGPGDRVKLFDSAAGFVPFATLAYASENAEAGRVIRRTIRAAVEEAPPVQVKGKFHRTVDLGPKATELLLALTSSENVNVRRFAVSTLCDLREERAVEKAFVAALKDVDDRVRVAAACGLIYREYVGSADAVADYVATLPAGDFRRGVMAYLARVNPTRYDYAGRLQEWFVTRKPAPHDTFAGTLKALPKGFYAVVKFDVDAERKVRIGDHTLHMEADELKAFTEMMDKLALPTLAPLPFSAEITVGFDNGKEYVSVRVQ